MFHNFANLAYHDPLGVEDDYDRRMLLESENSSAQLKLSQKSNSCTSPLPLRNYDIISDVSEDKSQGGDISQLTNLKPDALLDYEADYDIDYQAKANAQMEWRQRCLNDQKLKQEVFSRHQKQHVKRGEFVAHKAKNATVHRNTFKKPNQNAPVSSKNNERKAKIVRGQSQSDHLDGLKVLIPGRNPFDRPMLVNSKQARRILIMREKRTKRLISQVQEVTMGMGPKSFGKFTTVRTKDQVRSRVAYARKRVGGLFVSKQKQKELEGRVSDDSDTDDPD